MASQVKKTHRQHTLSRAESSRSLQHASGTEPQAAEEPPVGNAETTAVEASPAQPSQAAPDAFVPLRRDEPHVKKSRGVCTVEQTLTYTPAPGHPSIEICLRLTTATRGQRQTDQLKQTAYILRLEVLALSPDVALEGFMLGPWHARKLQLEAGSVYTADPVWAAFLPVTEVLRGRLYIDDKPRHQILDLPWKPETVYPGSEPFPG